MPECSDATVEAMCMNCRYETELHADGFDGVGFPLCPHCGRDRHESDPSDETPLGLGSNRKDYYLRPKHKDSVEKQEGWEYV